MKKKLLSDDLYIVDVIAVSGTKQEVQKVLNENKSDFVIPENCEGFCVKLPARALCIWIKNPRDFYILLHETIHLTRIVFADCGAITDLAVGDEHIAYYIAFWFRKLWRFFGNIKKRRKTVRKV